MARAAGPHLKDVCPGSTCWLGDRGRQATLGTVLSGQQCGMNAGGPKRREKAAPSLLPSRSGAARCSVQGQCPKHAGTV